MSPSEAAAARPRGVSIAWIRAVPAWAWLVALVACSAVVRYAFARRMPAPWIMVDELVYSELAKSFAEAGEFRWRDEPISAYGPVYPLLLSPAYAVFDAVPDAYAAAKAINSAVISLAAVPAYLLGRRVLSPILALVGALLAVAVPSMLYAGTLMTENAFYPAFLGACLALVLVLERPTLRRLLLLAALCVVAFATRVQAAALVPAIVTAPLLLAAMGGGRRTLREFRLPYAVTGAAGAALLAVQLARGKSLTSLLGAYEVVRDRDYDAGAVARWFVLHVAELDLYLGIVPFAALLVLLAVSPRLARAEQALLAATVAVTFWLVLVVAAFASLPTVERIEERNMFYVAPLFFVALLLWVERGFPRPRRVGAALVAAAAVAPALIPYDELIGVEARSDTLMLLPWWWLQDHVIDLSQVRWAVLACGIVVGAAILLVPARLALALPAFVLAYYALTLAPIENGRHGVRMASLGALFQGITTGRRDWVDAAVGRGADVAFVWSGRADAFTLWGNEFFNRSVGPVYELGPGLGGGLPATPVREAAAGYLVDEEGRRARAEYVLTDSATSLVGEAVARDRPKGIELLRVDGPLRRATVVRGLYEGDTWAGPRVTYVRRECRGGLLRIQLLGDARLVRGPQRIAFVGGPVFTIAPGAATTVAVPLVPAADGTCTTSFTVSPTAVPSRVLRGSTDTRRLGIHVLGFEYVPPRRAA